MTPERELWACALLIEGQHGVKSNEHIAKRVKALALAGDMAGVDRWMAIADCLDKLRDGGPTI
ncbi:MAG: hypothetical protein JNN10_17570 [Sphingopyxis sp.]|nr:hypothetical protein [Sphingopyxis sp.]